MKILYVDLKFDYGKEARGLNLIGEHGFRQVFLRHGHEVVPFYYDSYLQNTNVLQKELLSFAGQHDPDLIFFCLYTDQFYPETLLHLKEKFRTINWFGDDQWRFESFTSKFAPLFTYSITTDPLAVPKYRKLGVNPIVSQWGALENGAEAEIPEQLEYAYDISFIGGANPVRRWFINEFRKEGLNVASFGHGWPNGPVSLSRMAQIFRSSKINLNLSNSSNLDIRYLVHNWRNIPLAFRSQKYASQVKARNFEIPYMGGFQLTEYVPTLETYFTIGKEVACYSSLEDAIRLCRHYLENDSLREGIKAASVISARAKHTYFHRFREIFSEL